MLWWCRKNNISDHHLNLISRIDLLPPSYRGNQLKKYLAFMCIQVGGMKNCWTEE